MARNFDGAYSVAQEIDANTTVVLDTVSRGIYVGGTGDVTVELTNTDNTVTFSSVAASTILPVRATTVYANSTATDIVALS